MQQSGSADVDRFMSALVHPLKEGVSSLRCAMLDGNPDVSEHVEWNAPSFCHAGVDRVTFRLRPDARVQLVFHRGAKVRTDSAQFAFDDPSGLLTWLAPDRAVVTLEDADAIRLHQAEIVSLVTRWIAA